MNKARNQKTFINTIVPFNKMKNKMNFMEHLIKDPNWIAYHRDLKEGELNHLKGEYAAYHNGSFIKSADSIDSVLKKIDNEKIEVMVFRVGAKPPALYIRMPLKYQ